MSARAGGNPFHAIHAEAWADPIDVASINKGASDLVLERIEQVRRAGALKDGALRSSSVLLLGPAGTGKTHLFARLRKQAGRRAVFILSRPELGAEPSPRHVLGSIVESLRQLVSGDERRQIDVIVGAMLAAVAEGDPRYPLLQVDDLSRQTGEARRAVVDRIVARTEDRFPDIWPQYLERLLALPFADRQEQRALFAWLGGREPSPIELERAGASGPIPDAEILPALRTLGVAAAFGAPIVLVFDQLENLAEDGGKTGRILAHARLVSELRDTVRGLVIVQMALDAEWMTRIHPALHESDRARLEETVRMLGLPTPAERRELLERWRDALPEDERREPFPHPFAPADVEAWTRDRGMTPRMLMQACGEAYLCAGSPPAEAAEGELPAPPGPGERLRIQWDEAVEHARSEIDEAAQQAHGVAAERVLSGLLAALRTLGVDTGAPSPKPAPSLRVTSGGAAREVLVAQHTHPRSLAAVIRAAAALAGERPVLLLRERTLAIPPTWKEIGKLLASFGAIAGAVFAPIDREDLARLLALADFLTAARSQDLSADDGRPIPHAEVVRWVEAQLGCSTWAPVQAILAPRARAAVPAPASRAAAPAPTPPAAARSVAAILERLRVASIDRLVREAKAIDPAATRATVTGELARMRVRIFGGSVVALEDR